MIDKVIASAASNIFFMRSRNSRDVDGLFAAMLTDGAILAIFLGGGGGTLKMDDQKIQDLKMWDKMSRVENAGPENAGNAANLLS